MKAVSGYLRYGVLAMALASAPMFAQSGQGSTPRASQPGAADTHATSPQPGDTGTGMTGGQAGQRNMYTDQDTGRDYDFGWIGLLGLAGLTGLLRRNNRTEDRITPRS
jgi:MYXO-CTERM domain-containing protein